MKLKLGVIIITLFYFFQSSYSYIDPGTGGYLISSIWSSFVAFLAVVLGVIIHFFKYRVWTFITKYKYPLLILVAIITGYFTYDYMTKEGSMNYAHYDESLNGVQTYVSTNTYDGYNLYNGILMDMQGNEVKTWNYSYLSILDEEGNYYGQHLYESDRWGKFTFDDEPIWIKEFPIHHEIYITDNNTIYVFSKEVRKYNDRLVEFDTILEFDSNGNLLQNYSLWENLKMFQSFHRKLELDSEPNKILPEDHFKNTSIWGGNHDYYHMNSLTLVPKNQFMGMHRAFTPGNWIISFRHGSMVFILDKDTKQVLWTGIFDQVDGNLEGQHVPKMLENGDIRVFDNGRYRKKSRIIDINPIDLSVDLVYEHEDFFTESQGYYQSFPNGNMMIVQSDKGYVFEVDPSHSKVWEFYNPQNVTGKDDEQIRAEIYRMYRYDKSFIEPLLNK